MKDKLIKAVAIATVTIISGALVAYLKEPENRALVAKYAKKYSTKAKKYAKKSKKSISKKLKEYKL